MSSIPSMATIGCIIAVFIAASLATEVLAQCGGELSGNNDTLRYPDVVGQPLIPGEVCVWTLHLENTRDFKFNISRLNVHSNFADCRDGGIRIYSINNLVPEGQPESYTFCDQKPSTDTFYLGNTMAVIVLYSSPSNWNPGTGFTVSWEGASYDSFRTKHISSFSSASQAVIKYPVIGKYEASLAATWLIKTGTSKSDISLQSVNLEACANVANPCTCDALFLYEINDNGVLSERRRFCYGTDVPEFFSSVESRFLFAFFSDFETLSGGGNGFDAIYLPTNSTGPTTTNGPVTSTTTTRPPSSTTEWTDPTTRCGSVLNHSRDNPNGTILYKAGSLYKPNERCAWMIRIPEALSVTFRLIQSGLSGSDFNDNVFISAWNSNNPFDYNNTNLRIEGELYQFSGSNMFVVAFISDASSEGLGIRLDYYTTTWDGKVDSADSTSFISGVNDGVVRHPEFNDNYSDNEYSFFLFSLPDYSISGRPTVYTTWSNWGLDDRPNAEDNVALFKLGNVLDPKPWTLIDVYTSNDNIKPSNHTDMMLYVFKSDEVNTSSGFNIVWYTLF